jgi:hypothetical protein
VIESRRDLRGTWHLCKTEEVLAGFWCGDLKERNHLEDLVVNGEIMLKIGLH